MSSQSYENEGIEAGANCQLLVSVRRRWGLVLRSRARDSPLSINVGEERQIVVVPEAANENEDHSR